jgi:hypothetical protein
VLSGERQSLGGVSGISTNGRGPDDAPRGTGVEPVSSSKRPPSRMRHSRGMESELPTIGRPGTCMAFFTPCELSRDPRELSILLGPVARPIGNRSNRRATISTHKGNLRDRRSYINTHKLRSASATASLPNGRAAFGIFIDDARGTIIPKLFTTSLFDLSPIAVTSRGRCWRNAPGTGKFRYGSLPRPSGRDGWGTTAVTQRQRTGDRELLTMHFWMILTTHSGL